MLIKSNSWAGFLTPLNTSVYIGLNDIAVPNKFVYPGDNGDVTYTK